MFDVAFYLESSLHQTVKWVSEWHLFWGLLLWPSLFLFNLGLIAALCKRDQLGKREWIIEVM